MKNFLLFCTVFLCFPIRGKSDCTIDNINSINGPLNMASLNAVGQQFTACETGFIESIELQIDFDVSTTTPKTGDVDFYLVSGDGSNIGIGSPLQTFTNITDGIISLQLTHKFVVKSGQMYAFAVGGADLAAITLDMMPNSSTADTGALIGFDATNVFSTQTPSDLYFAVTIGVEQIPTLSDWCLLIFGLLVLNLGIYLVQQRIIVT
ncbi:MAG: hypothetical protein AAGJ18_20575 [Bacteroidota bacterium]